MQVTSEPVFALTADVDWAGESAIAGLQRIFDEYDVRPTYFVTHESELLQRLHDEGRAELGIHPNFLPGSSHGASIGEVLDTVCALVPDARCFRAHMYFDATPVTRAVVQRGIRYDSNLCTDLQPGLIPIRHESGLVRFPAFYEDGSHASHRRSWNFAGCRDTFGLPGLKVISVHPMNTVLNVRDPVFWGNVKSKYRPDEWVRLTDSDLADNAQSGPGPRRFLRDLLEFVRDGNLRIATLAELYEESREAWRASDERR